MYFLAAGVALSCHKEEIPSDYPQSEDCRPGQVIKTVKDQNGTVRFNARENRYAIYVSIPITYDSQDLGFVCHLPDSLRKEGLSIIFDGKYHTYEKDRLPPLGGQVYYYLTLDKVRRK